MKRASYPLSLLALIAAAAASAGCGDGQQQELVLAPPAALPNVVRSAPPVVVEAYRFAIANPEALNTIPCYCGCGGMGHTSNLDCYVKEFRADGSIVFDNHALG
ncbi:MAG: hypothetical protein GTN78_24470 [Gemmatimonadales bacterium]|nr:hypothetical protein [Gemmatimonadales bacterium]NIN12082.1 hypothetical protein [Gemmatimonadales bacterium]NIR03317.1 hypothetical protein [Gemmatimonadales bacterium]NIS66997.1 hypothetical protein [Gemmatimonadales bacterium]